MSPALATGSLLYASMACLRVCLRHCTVETASVSTHYDGIRKKITQQAFVKLTLVKLLSPERRTVVAVSHPDRQQNLMEKNDENNRTKEPRGGFRLSYRP